ncbi:MAG: S1 RNA-binding domain-containing protein, partial [Candidatus Firestonebacteria bacterium]
VADLADDVPEDVLGHGALAEKALMPVIPTQEKFPYVINLVSDILESNGSSSMASVCGATLSLMDAGVPIISPVAGISIGLVKEESCWATITDIAGIEDHFGDMDFKVAGTAKGITAIQLDMKVEGISDEIIEKTLSQAKTARMLILDKITEAISNPRTELSKHAPRIVTIKVHQDKIKIIIGPSGKMIKKIVEETGAKIDIDDDGTVHVSSVDSVALEAALNRIKEIAREAEMGATYTGKVKKVAEFGAFVEIFPGQDGLCHISELDVNRVKRVEDVCKEGDILTVKVIGIDDKTGKIKLSRKAILNEKGGTTGN